MKQNIKTFISRFKDKVRNTSDRTMLSLGRKKFLLNSIARYKARLLIFSLSKHSKRISPRLRRLSNFIDSILKFYSHHGALTTVKWLKDSNVAIQRAIAGDPCKSLRDIEPSLPLPRLANGLPTFIGTLDRKAIRALHPGTIRMWLTITSIYRIFKAPMKVNLNTITDPCLAQFDVIKLISKDASKYLSHLGLKELNIKPSEYPIRSLSAGPNNKVSISSLLTDAIALAKYPEIYDHFKLYANLTKSFGLFKTLNLVIDLCFDLLTRYGKGWIPHSKSVLSFDDIALGKLSFKEEAAGKLRIFAICDIWTQSLLSPLHDSLFNLLKLIPNDGTFDQDASFARCLLKSKEAGLAYSADLSSATDRLPIDLQIDILNNLTGTSLGTHWGGLLRDRPFIIRGNPYNIPSGSYVSYNTGQPMGCLSSWAMLALTHHLILQYCASLVYPNLDRWETRYEILGDDIVIFDKLLFDQYILVMKQLNVGVNLSKSLIAHDRSAFEFAKRTGVNGLDVSALSWKQVMAEDSLLGRVNQAVKFGRKGLIPTVSMLVKALSPAVNIRINDFLLNYKKDALYGLMALLGYMAHSNHIPLSNAVALLVDPHDEEYEFLENPSLPFTSTLHYVTRLLNIDLGFADPKDLIPQVSSFDERVDTANEEVIPFMADSLTRDALSRIATLQGTYDASVEGFAATLLSYSTHFDGTRGIGLSHDPKEPWKEEVANDPYGEDIIPLSKVDLARVHSVAEWALLKDRDPEDMHDEIYTYVYNLRSDLPPYKVALDKSSRVDNYISSFDFLPEGKANKLSPIPNTLREIKASGKLSVTPYWRIVMP